MMSRWEISHQWPCSQFRTWCSVFEVDAVEVDEEYMQFASIHNEQ